MVIATKIFPTIFAVQTLYPIDVGVEITIIGKDGQRRPNRNLLRVFRMSKIQMFLSLVSEVKNGSFVTIEKTSEHKMKKTGNPLRDSIVMKTSKLQVQVGCDMQRIENKNAKTESREARQIGPLPWGEYVEGLPVIKHKDTLYLRGFFAKGLGSSYTVNGIAANDNQLETIANFSQRQPMAKTAPLTIKLESITRLSGGGKEIIA
jgi:hypothetical protein